MSGSFTTSLNYEDYLAANWLMLRRRWIWRGSIKYVAIMAPVFMGITALDTATAEWDAFRIAATIITGIVFALGTLCLQYVAFRILIPRSARKCWKQLHIDGLPTFHEFDATGIRISNVRGTSNFDWTMLTSWVEDDRLLLMFRTKLMFHAVPKSEVAAGELKALRAVMAAAGVSTKC